MPTWQTLPYGATRYKIPGVDSGFVGEDPRCPKKWYDRYRQYYRAYTWSIRDTGVYDHYLYYFCQDGPIQCAEGNEWVQVLQQCAPKCAAGEERNTDGICESKCPVPPLSEPFPPPGDDCTASLEKGKGADVDGKCPRPPILDDPKGEPCLRDKLNALGIPYNGPTATIRTPAYQGHLKEIWDKWLMHESYTDPKIIQACAERKAAVKNEMDKHGLDYEPVGDSHNKGKAFDISRDTVNELAKKVTTDGSDIQDYLDSAYFNPPSCNLYWGGKYKKSKPDRVHFSQP